MDDARRMLKDLSACIQSKPLFVVACYNFIRPHETLNRDEVLIFRPKTPTMTAGMVDHRWTFPELLAHPALCQ